MRIIITGNTGFIGKHIVDLLLEQGHTITGLSRSAGKDITNTTTFDNIRQYEVLIHLAAQSFVPLSFKEPARFYNDNLIGTLNCLEDCRKKGAKMIFLSSYVYGQSQILPITEDHPVQPTNPYMTSKYLGEQLCQAYQRDFNVPVCIIRPFNVYGKGQGDNFLIPTIINQLPGGEIRLNDPRPRRDFVHVADLAEAIAGLLDFKKQYAVYNIGSGVSTAIGEIIDILQSHFFVAKNKIFYSNEHRSNEVLETCADISKAWQDFGWKPKKNFAEELVRIASEKIITKRVF